MLKKSKIEKSDAVLFKSPPSPSSPKTKNSLSIFSFCKAIKSAIGRSKCEPFFGTSDGDKFIMIFEGGNLKFRLKSADFTLLSLSFMVVPANPTTPKPGNPLTKLDSTSTLTRVSVKAALFRDFIFLFVFS